MSAVLVTAGCTRDADADGDGDGEEASADDRATLSLRSTEVDGNPSDLDITDDLLAYTAIYRVEALDGDTVRVTSEKLVVERPWSSRFEQFLSEDASGDPTSLEIGIFGRRLVGAGGQPLLIALPPALAPADVRLDTLADAEARDRVERREHRRLEGRTCQVLRSAAGLFGSTLAPIADDARDYVDTCVDADGVTVEEAFYVGGRLNRLRTLASVESDVRGDDQPFKIEGTPATTRQGGGSMQRVTPESLTPESMLLPAAEPAGFTKRGRYAAVPPQAENFTDPTREGRIVAGVVDVYERGADVLVLDQGGTLRGVDPFPAPPEGAETIDLGSLGTAEVLVSLRMNELRVLRTGGRYLRVYGTLTVDELEAFARTLREVPGGTLTPLPDAPL